MEWSANVQIGDPVRALGVWAPGSLRIDDDGVAFHPKSGDSAHVLAYADVARVRITSHLIGADEVLLELPAGGAWSVKVSGGEALVEELRRRGVTVG